MSFISSALFCQVGQATSPAESEKWEATVVRREEGVK